MNWEIVIGLEIHAQLITATKAFCRCPNRYAAPPNTLTCPTCLGMPGALPVLNREAVRQAAKLALVLGANIHPRSKFDRKNYFYPDLPKGYQISQYDEPLSTGGSVDIDTNAGTKRIGITRAHIEEDAGKSMHQTDGTTIVDMNRCGVPLVEIVTEPEFRSPAEAAVFVSTMRELLRFIGVCDGNMERGSLRCDANISVRPSGQSALNERCEIKNLNSIRGIERAVRAEAERQIGVYVSGGKVVRQTLLWDEVAEEPRPMRRKEGSDDYRYFPEPDLVEMQISPDFIERVRAEIGPVPRQARRRLREEYGWNAEQTQYAMITGSAGYQYVTEMLKISKDSKIAASLFTTTASGIMNEKHWSIEEFKKAVPSESFAKVVEYTCSGRVSMSGAAITLQMMADTGSPPDEIITRERLELSNDKELIEKVVHDVLANNPVEVELYKKGKKNLLGFFVGEARRVTGAKVDPKQLSHAIQSALEME